MIFDNIMDIYHRTWQDISKCSSVERMSYLKVHRKELKFLEDMRQSFMKDNIHLGQMQKKCLSISLHYASKEALCLLWSKYITGDLKRILQTGLISEYVLKICNVTSIQLEVFISKEDYDECLERMG